MNSISPVCIVILSEKSCGSSVLNRNLRSAFGARYIEKTEHYEGETLFWTKAASILGEKQLDASDSVVPYSKKQAFLKLRRLALENGIPFPYAMGSINKMDIFSVWEKIVVSRSPVFVEKSPHHLFQRSNLELMLEFKKAYPGIKMVFIGLVRDPYDVAYSQFTRWQGNPKNVLRQWTVAYKNLRWLVSVDSETIVVKYEDLVDGSGRYFSELQKIGLSGDEGQGGNYYSSSVGRWHDAKFFYVNVDADTAEVMCDYGYSVEGFNRFKALIWVPYFLVSKAVLPTLRYINRLTGKRVSQITKSILRKN
jgi:hypothetical protein